MGNLKVGLTNQLTRIFALYTSLVNTERVLISKISQKSQVGHPQLMVFLRKSTLVWPIFLSFSSYHSQKKNYHFILDNYFCNPRNSLPEQKIITHSWLSIPFPSLVLFHKKIPFTYFYLFIVNSFQSISVILTEKCSSPLIYQTHQWFITSSIPIYVTLFPL